MPPRVPWPCGTGRGVGGCPVHHKRATPRSSVLGQEARPRGRQRPVPTARLAGLCEPLATGAARGPRVLLARVQPTLCTCTASARGPGPRSLPPTSEPSAVREAPLPPSCFASCRPRCHFLRGRGGGGAAAWPGCCRAAGWPGCRGFGGLSRRASPSSDAARGRDSPLRSPLPCAFTALPARLASIGGESRAASTAAPAVDPDPAGVFAAGPPRLPCGVGIIVPLFGHRHLCPEQSDGPRVDPTPLLPGARCPDDPASPTG